MLLSVYLQAWELIEPVDGFHPNQQANALVAEAIYTFLDTQGMLPAINPSNDVIRTTFGDQGGY